MFKPAASDLRRVVPGAKIIGLAMFAGVSAHRSWPPLDFHMIVSKHEGRVMPFALR